MGRAPSVPTHRRPDGQPEQPLHGLQTKITFQDLHRNSHGAILHGMRQAGVGGSEIGHHTGADPEFLSQGNPAVAAAGSHLEDRLSAAVPSEVAIRLELDLDPRRCVSLTRRAKNHDAGTMPNTKNSPKRSSRAKKWAEERLAVVVRTSITRRRPVQARCVDASTPWRHEDAATKSAPCRRILGTPRGATRW